MVNQSFRAALYTIGRPFSPLYAYAMKIRALLYSRNLLKRYNCGVPVISVGNLTMGGTGKTPLVIHLAQFLHQAGYRPAVVSRGYRGRARQPVNIVSDGERILLSQEDAGDEPYLIAGKVRGVVVMTGRKRIYPCLAAVEQFNCDVIILDDGFQHLVVSRILDLVLFDTEFFAGNSRVFPGGDLREPVSALKRCDAFILTGVTEHSADRAMKCRELLQDKFPDKQTIELHRVYASVREVFLSSADHQSRELPVEEIPDRLYGFCGIAQPERFFSFAREHDLTLTATATFADHHHYSPIELERICRAARESGAKGLLTTEKDLVKLKSITNCTLPLYVPVLDIRENPLLTRLVMSKLPSVPDR